MQFSKQHFHSRVKLSGIQFSLHLVKMHSWRQLISSPDLHPTTVQCTKVFLNYPEVTGTNYITIKYCVLPEISFNPLGYIQNFISPIQLTIFTLKWPKNSLQKHGSLSFPELNFSFPPRIMIFSIKCLLITQISLQEEAVLGLETQGVHGNSTASFPLQEQDSIF